MRDSKGDLIILSPRHQTPIQIVAHISSRSSRYSVNANMLVLFVATSAARMENLISVVAETSTGGSTSFMLFQHLPQFGHFFVPPKPLPQLFSGPWRRAGCDEFSIDRV